MHEGMLFLPSWMTPSSRGRENELFLLKNKCIAGRAAYDVYVKAVLSTLRGKSGYTRSVSTMSIQGSLRMVISPGHTCSDNSIYVPRYIAERCVVPVIEGDHYHSSRLSDCRYVILVRQPCMWTGGIQPVELRLTDPDLDDGVGPDVNCSMKVPLALCTPFGADFDGDEMTIFGVRTTQSEMECATFAWDHDKYSPYNDEDYNKVVHSHADEVGTMSNTMAICTTICWTDRIYGVRATPVHAKWMTSVSSMIAMTNAHESPRHLANKGMESMRVSCAKSSSQSDVGASTRRSRIGSSRVHLSSNGIPMFGRRNMSVMCPDHIIYCINRNDGWFGNPTIRAVSKLCSSVMQLTLKVKSMTNVQNLSPTLSLLSGSTSWLTIAHNREISIHTMDDLSDHRLSQTICSLYDISHAPDNYKDQFLEQFVNIVLLECRRSLDIAEHRCLVLLLREIVKAPLKRAIGIQTVIGSDYPEFSPFAVFSLSYVDAKFARSYVAYKTPSTVAEHMLIRYFHNIPSIM